jgi:hypothetical protein
MSGSIRLALPRAVATNGLIRLDAGAAVAGPVRNHLNCGIAGAVMLGCGSGASLEAFPTPLGSTTTLFIPPAFAGPRAIPLIGTFPVAAEPAGRANPAEPPCCANEAAGAAKTKNNAKAIFTVVFGMGKLH